MDIVLVPFPFTNLKSTKRRPAVVISPDVYNQNQDIVVAFVTSNLQSEERFGDYRIRRWSEAGLPKPSKIRMKVATIEKSLVIKKLGRLVHEDSKTIRFVLLEFFGLE
jgi:mRNA interferase MazF